MAGLWERWRRATSYPLLWIGLYLCWLAFFGCVIFGWSWLSTSLSAAVFAVAALIPPCLIGVSQWMERVYYPDGR
jgi:hypothetical protein